MDSLKGTGVALITPFDHTGKVDYKSFSKLLEHTAKGVNYYVVQGTTGESVTTTSTEKAEILQFVKENNPSKLPIVYGIGGNNTMALVDTIKSTNFNGVNALLSVSPYYNKPSQEGIIAHFTKIAEASPIPVLLYNVPSRTGSNMAAATTITLAQHENIIGIKEASGDVAQVLNIIKNTADNFLVISGDDLLTPTLLAEGAVGVISVLANAFPIEFRNMMTFAEKNDVTGASAAIQSLAELNPLLYEESNPVGIKEVLKLMGICGNTVRLPLLPASANLSQRIKQLL